MSRFAANPRPTFARDAAPDDERPRTHLSRAALRRQAALHEARQVLDVIPAPGHALHALVTGRYDLLQLVLCLIDRVGPLNHLRIATLSYGVRNLADLLGLLDVPQPPRLTLLCSAFFRDHNKDLWSETLEAFRERGARAAADRTHAKVVCLDCVSGAKLVIEGSANLRSNSNREQLALIHDAGLHDWHAAWIDEQVSLHEGENDDGSEAAAQ